MVLVDFWASWCAPCKASFPVYSRLNAAYAARGLVIVAVSVDDSAAAYSAFVARLKPTFATVHDAKHKLVAQVQVPTMPTSYLVDRSGKVRFVHPGFHGDADRARAAPGNRVPPRRKGGRAMRISASRCLLLSALAAAGAVLCGCTSAAAVRVKPWERAALADDTMNPDRDPLGTAMCDHVYFSREAASGGRGVGGSGCGCN